MFSPALSHDAILANANELKSSNPGAVDRVTVIQADGTYLVDTNSPPPKENHNTRISIMAAQICPRGLGWERKYSNTVGNNEYYLSRRCDVSGYGFHQGPNVVRIAKFA
jgi:hypothetical protein